MAQQSPFHIVQLTDTHLFADPQQVMRGCVTAETCTQVLEHLQTLSPKPDLLLLTGDLSQDETPQSYQHLRDLVEPLQIPACWIPGNHDHLPAMQSILQQGVFSAAKALLVGGWQILLLNSQVIGQTAGLLSPASLVELEQRLRRHPMLPTLIALHHPPCVIHSPWMDDLRLQNASALYAVIDQHPQVQLVIFGHIHQAFATSRGPVTYLGSPSTCIQFKPELTTLELDEQAPGFRWLTLHPDGRFETQVMRLK